MTSITREEREGNSMSCPFEKNSLGRNIFKGSRGRSICFGLMTLISEIGWISLTQTVVSPTLPTIVTPPLPPFGERAFPQSRAPLYHGSVLPPLFSPCLPFFSFPHFRHPRSPFRRRYSQICGFHARRETWGTGQLPFQLDERIF